MAATSHPWEETIFVIVRWMQLSCDPDLGRISGTAASKTRGVIERSVIVVAVCGGRETETDRERKRGAEHMIVTGARAV